MVSEKKALAKEACWSGFVIHLGTKCSVRSQSGVIEMKEEEEEASGMVEGGVLERCRHSPGVEMQHAQREVR